LAAKALLDGSNLGSIASSAPFVTGVVARRIIETNAGREHQRPEPPVPGRRFPPPWTVEETDACFIVKDHTGQSLA
jgi:hypothetical protein